LFNFYKYIETFNSGDDQAMLDQFWVDDLEVTSNRSNMPGISASGKQEFLKFLIFAHDGVREIMRIQTLIENENNIFAEIDMDFYASKDRPDYPFGHLEPGDLITVKMFSLYYLRGDRIANLKMASWQPNIGITESPTRGFGPPPPILEGTRKVL